MIEGHLAGGFFDLFDLRGNSEAECAIAILRALLSTPFERCDKRPGKVSSTALVRYRMNDYSVPTAYCFRTVLMKGFVDEVAIICGTDEIARRCLEAIKGVGRGGHHG